MVYPADHWIPIEARDIPILLLEKWMDEFHPMSFQCIHNRARSIHSLHLRLNERKAKQTLGINKVHGMNDNVGKFDILIFASAYKGCPCIILCFLVFHSIKRPQGLKEKKIIK